MSAEIEVKVLNIDRTSLRIRLHQAGCQRIGIQFQINFMYDFPDKRLFKADGSYIRLRQIQDMKTGHSQTLLTFKKTVSRDQYKVADEIETQVADREAMHRFLLELGLEHIRIDEKIRETYHHGSICFELDEWAGLPPYLEVEAPDKESVKKGLEMIGYTLEDATSMNLQEVMEMYHIQASHLRFSDFGRTILIERHVK